MGNKKIKLNLFLKEATPNLIKFTQCPWLETSWWLVQLEDMSGFGILGRFYFDNQILLFFIKSKCEASVGVLYQQTSNLVILLPSYGNPYFIELFFCVCFVYGTNIPPNPNLTRMK